MSDFYIALTYACHLRCINCPLESFDKKTRRLKLQDIKFAFQDADFCPGTDQVTISGGEPTLHPDFLDIVEYITRHLESNVSVLSNSTRFSDHYFVDKLKLVANGRLSITTAIYGDTPALHDKITQKIGSFEQTILGLTNLLSRGIPISLKTVIQKKNYLNLPEIANFVNRTFPSEVQFIFEGMDIVGQALNYLEQITVSFQEIAPSLELAIDYFENVRPIVVQSVPLCAIDPYYWNYFSTDPKNRLESYRSPHTELVSNYVRTTGTTLNKCKECVFVDRCPGLWYSYLNVYGDENLHPFIK